MYLGMPASPSVSGSKSAAGSRGAAKLQKELPPVALLQQRHIGLRPCGLSAYNLTRGMVRNVMPYCLCGKSLPIGELIYIWFLTSLTGTRVFFLSFVSTGLQTLIGSPDFINATPKPNFHSRSYLQIVLR